MHANVIDLVALVFVLLNAALGWKRGLSGELARMISVVGALALGFFFYRPFGLWLLDHSRVSPESAKIIAFVATLLAAGVVMILLRLLFGRIGSVVIEQGVDKWLGCMAGFLRALVYVVIIFLAANLWPHKFLNRQFGKESMIGRVILKVVPSVRSELDAAPGLDELRRKMGQSSIESRTFAAIASRGSVWARSFPSAPWRTSDSATISRT
jgi:uncharacterized membrane protein required for colicin V production